MSHHEHVLMVKIFCEECYSSTPHLADLIYRYLIDIQIDICRFIYGGCLIYQRSLLPYDQNQKDTRQYDSVGFLRDLYLTDYHFHSKKGLIFTADAWGIGQTICETNDHYYWSYNITNHSRYEYCCNLNRFMKGVGDCRYSN